MRSRFAQPNAALDELVRKFAVAQSAFTDRPRGESLAHISGNSFATPAWISGQTPRAPGQVHGCRRETLCGALAPPPGAHGLLLFFGAPAIDHIDAETPFRTHAKARQLFGSQQAIDRGRMYPQVLRELTYRQDPWRCRRDAGFLRAFIFHALTLINSCSQMPARRYSC